MKFNWNFFLFLIEIFKNNNVFKHLGIGNEYLKIVNEFDLKLV